MRKQRLIQALLRKPVDRTPIWIMRQAGRYLPEYRSLRAKVGNFLTLCKTPELACEITLQPLRRFPLDAAIVFSDILTIPDAMGLGLYFIEGEGPQFLHPICSQAAIESLPIPDPSKELRYVGDTIALCRKELKNQVPLIGFSGSPWTLACYMIEGQSSATFPKIGALLRQEPKTLHRLLNTLAKAVINYLNAQIHAGAEVVMLFDTWGSLLSAASYQDYSLTYIRQIISHLIREYNHQPVPVIVFTKGGSIVLDDIANSHCDAIGLDSSIDIGEARQRVGNRVALQGNLDPHRLLNAHPDQIWEEVRSILNRYGRGSGHVFNLGHGILPGTPLENVSTLIDAVHTLSPSFHQKSG